MLAMHSRSQGHPSLWPVPLQWPALSSPVGHPCSQTHWLGKKTPLSFTTINSYKMIASLWCRSGERKLSHKKMKKRKNIYFLYKYDDTERFSCTSFTTSYTLYLCYCWMSFMSWNTEKCVHFPRRASVQDWVNIGCYKKLWCMWNKASVNVVPCNFWKWQKITSFPEIGLRDLKAGKIPEQKMSCQVLLSNYTFSSFFFHPPFDNGTFISYYSIMNNCFNV